MARRQIKCPYCEKVLGVAGVASHLRSIHPEHFEAFTKDKAAFYAKHDVAKAASEMPEKAPESAPVKTSVETDTPTPPTQDNGGEPAKADKTFHGEKSSGGKCTGFWRF